MSKYNEPGVLDSTARQILRAIRGIGKKPAENKVTSLTETVLATGAVVEAVGISDIRAKCLRSRNPANVVAATMQGLRSLRNVEQVAKTRGLDTDQLIG